MLGKCFRPEGRVACLAGVSSWRERVACLADVSSGREKVACLAGVSTGKGKGSLLNWQAFQVGGKG